MRHYIQYHNPERYGPVNQPAAGEPFWVATNKPAARLPGNCIWLVVGTGRPSRYYLYHVFQVEWVAAGGQADFHYRLAGRLGARFQPPLELNGLPWFEALKRRLANFSLGLTALTPAQAGCFISLARPASAAYRQAEAQGWIQPP
jgi:hypothetical protein